MKKTIWVHAGLQLFTYAFAISGMGIGVWLAVSEQAVSKIGYFLTLPRAHR